MKRLTRKDFVYAGLGLTVSTIFLKRSNKPAIQNTIKFLSQEGKLVEIDADKLPTERLIASKTDIQDWIKR